MRLFFLVLVFQVSLVGNSVATDEYGYTFKSPELQVRYSNLINEIRCPVCQGQSIGGSNAPLAQDLRRVVQEMLVSGNTDAEIFTFMRERYGDFVIFKPPVNEQTYLLWFAPILFVLLAFFFVLRCKKDTSEISTNKNTDTAEELLNGK